MGVGVTSSAPAELHGLVTSRFAFADGLAPEPGERDHMAKNKKKAAKGKSAKKGKGKKK